MQASDVRGYDHILDANAVLKAVVEDLFTLPGAALDRARAERERLGEDDHGDNLLCGCWSAASAATSLLELGGRHVDALIVLANASPALPMSAGVLARAAFEALMRVTWLLEPSTASDREHRWVALRREELRFARNTGQLGDADMAARLQALDRQDAALQGTPVGGTPSMEVLSKRCRGSVYEFYRWMSQPAHGTLVGASSLDLDARFEWNAAGGKGEWVEAQFWSMPLVMCWEALRLALPAYRDLLVPDHAMNGLESEPRFIRALRSVPMNFQAKRHTASRQAAPPTAQPDRSLNRAQRRAQARRRQG